MGLLIAGARATGATGQYYHVFAEVSEFSVFCFLTPEYFCLKQHAG